MALLHQDLDDVHPALRHPVGELLDGDGFWNRDFSNELFLGLIRSVALEALHSASERGDGPLAFFVGAKRSDKRQPSAILLRAGAWRLRGRRGPRPSAAPGARRLLLVR